MKRLQLYTALLFILIIWLPLSGFFFFTPTWESIENQIQEEFPMVNHIEIDELSRIISSEELMLLDVREADEFAVSQIQDARHIESPEEVQADKQTRIVVYCSVGYRSARFARELQEKGFVNVYNLRGSIFAWANQGYPLYQGNERTGYVHPFNKKWGLLLDERFHLYPDK